MLVDGGLVALSATYLTFFLFSPTLFFPCLFSIQLIAGSFPGFLVQTAAAFYADVYAAADVVTVVLDDDVVPCCSC